jgi:hypothetical protein
MCWACRIFDVPDSQMAAAGLRGGIDPAAARSRDADAGNRLGRDARDLHPRSRPCPGRGGNLRWRASVPDVRSGGEAEAGGKPGKSHGAAARGIESRPSGMGSDAGSRMAAVEESSRRGFLLRETGRAAGDRRPRPGGARAASATARLSCPHGVGVKPSGDLLSAAEEACPGVNP